MQKIQSIGDMLEGHQEGAAMKLGDKTKTPPPSPTDVRMTRLAESFRCLEYKPGVRPWNAQELADWVKSDGATPAEVQAVAFVLEVANMTGMSEDVPPFNMHDAVALWSREDRAAFAAWTRDPWFA